MNTKKILALVMAFVSQLRGNGMYVILIVMVIYSVYLFMKSNRRMAALLPILTITFILLISSLNVAYDVQDNEKDALMVEVLRHFQGEVIECYYEMDEGYLLYLEARIKRLLDEKKL